MHDDATHWNLDSMAAAGQFGPQFLYGGCDLADTGLNVSALGLCRAGGVPRLPCRLVAQHLGSHFCAGGGGNALRVRDAAAAPAGRFSLDAVAGHRSPGADLRPDRRMVGTPDGRTRSRIWASLRPDVPSSAGDALGAGGARHGLRAASVMDGRHQPLTAGK